MSVVGQLNMHDGLYSGHTETIMITQSEEIYSAQMSHQGEASSPSRYEVYGVVASCS